MLFEKQMQNIYRSTFASRCDDRGDTFYFSPSDFEGLQSRPFSFRSTAGNMLKGYFYHYNEPIAGRLIVFDHGFGGGHRAYMREIELLCRQGYLVYSYDHTGCMESEGDSPNGLAQSLCDLNDCLTALKQLEGCEELDISVMGHSWGGFSTLNICALHPDVSHIVVFSGFISVEQMLCQNFNGILKGFRKCIYQLEAEKNPMSVKYNAVESLSATDAEVLLVYSDNDKMVSRKFQFDVLYQALAGKKNVRFLLLNNKQHNPNYTENAVKLLGDFTAKLAKFRKKKNVTAEEKATFRNSFDWRAMTEQDMDVWEQVFKTLEK